MCGIAAILLQPQTRTPEQLQEIRKVFTENLLFNEIRGQAATGAVVIQADGTAFLHKLPVTATELVKTKGYQDLLAVVDSNTTLLLGHTRHPTKGDPNLALNNHPIKVGPVFGVHNGHIDNDDLLFAEYGFPRQAEVDSEIIFQLLKDFPPFKCNDEYLSMVQSHLSLLRGEFTFLSCDLRVPTKVLVTKHMKPLSTHYHEGWNALIFSSRYLYLRKIFGRKVVLENLPSDQLLLFDAQDLKKYGAEPVCLSPLR